jgi:hypothetical protein
MRNGRLPTSGAANLCQMLTIQHCKESLSRAYITAVVGRARHNILWHREFDYGVDGTVRQLEYRGSRIRETAFGFEFQSKATVDWTIEGEEVVYDLEANAYNDLVQWSDKTAFPFLLVLLCLPQDESKWLDVTVNQLVLQKCAFWCKVRGVVVPNSSSRRIRIPVASVFTPTAVSEILANIRNGVLLP